MTKTPGALIGVAAVLAVGTAVALPGRAAAACSGWNLYNDFQTTPSQANPNPDSCGNSAVWYFDKSTAAVHDPTNYVALDTYTDNFSGASGLDGWYNSSSSTITPHVVKNTNAGNATFSTVTVPGHSIDVHPGSKASAADGFYVVVGWKSPITGSVDITGGVSSNDPNGGDGIAWTIDTYKGSTNTTLTGGSYADGGSEAFSAGSGGPSSITGVSVTAGDYIYFVIDPKDTYYYDSTDLNVTITPTPGTPVPELPLGAVALAGAGALAAVALGRRLILHRTISS